jgi:hypothetical protein
LIVVVLFANAKQRERRMADRSGFKSFSIVANCINGSRAARCYLRKIGSHGLPSNPGYFLHLQ